MQRADFRRPFCYKALADGHARARRTFVRKAGPPAIRLALQLRAVVDARPFGSGRPRSGYVPEGHARILVIRAGDEFPRLDVSHSEERLLEHEIRTPLHALRIARPRR